MTTAIALSPGQVDALNTALGNLAIARGASLDDDGAAVYLVGLSDLEPRLVERACFALSREPRAEFAPALPTVGEIRQRVSTIVREDRDAEQARVALLPAPKTGNDEPTYFCLECLDESSGWRIFACGGHKVVTVDLRATQRIVGFDARHCGRLIAHQPHSFTERCTCWQRNPVVARRQARQQTRRSA